MAKLSLSSLKGDEGPFAPAVPEEVIAAAEARAKSLRQTDEADPGPASKPPGPSTAGTQGAGPSTPAQASPGQMPAQPPVFGVPEEPAGPPADLPETAQASPETPGMLARSDIDALRQSALGVITRGDSLPEVPDLRPRTEAERLAALGIPRRPQTWPSFMAWPPQVVLDRMTDPDMTDEKRALILRELLEMDRRMLRRSLQIHDWLEEHNPLSGQDRATRTEVRKSGADPHFGIKWATLINPGLQDRAIAATVVTWGYTTARTVDGGIVRATESGISFGGSGGTSRIGLTPQAVKLGIQEARNRGWKSINMSGCHEFGMMAIQAAREAGIEATIRYRGKGPMFWKTYTVKVMPNMPLPEMSETPDAPPEMPAPAVRTGSPTVIAEPDGVRPRRLRPAATTPDEGSEPSFH